MITTNGKAIALRYLAGVQPSLVSEIAVGIGNAATTASDTRLNFEVGRFPVVASTISGVDEQVVFQGSAPINDEYKIYEIGIFPKQSTVSGNTIDGLLLATFSQGDGATFTGATSGLDSSADFRIGSTGAKIDTSGGTCSIPSAGDYSRFNVSDYINCAFITAGNSFNFTVELYDTSGNSTSVTFSETGITNGTSTPSGGKMVVASASGSTKYVIFQKPMTSVSSNLASLSYVKITNNSSSNWLKMDGLRMDDADSINPLNSMVARTVPATVREKSSGFTVDVEYRLTVNF